MNKNNSFASNDNWQRYLYEKDLHEEGDIIQHSQTIFLLAFRKSNRDLAVQAYEEEKARILEELKFNKAIHDFKRKKIKEFWDTTFDTLGQEILFQKSNSHLPLEK